MSFRVPEKFRVRTGPRLHLWRPVGVEMPSPPTWMVGVKA